MRKLFVNIYHFLNRQPVVLWTIFAILVVSLGFAASRLRFVEDISSFLPQNEDNKRINYAYQHLGSSNKIVVNIKDADADGDTQKVDYDLLMEAVDMFVEKMEDSDSSNYIKEIFYGVTQQQINEVTEFVINNMPYFLTEDDYARMDTLLTQDNIRQQLYNDKMLLASPVSTLQPVVISDPLFFSSNVLKKLAGFQLNEQYHNLDDYIFNKEETEAVVVINSNYPISETDNNGKLISNIDKAMKAVELELDGQVELSSFGASLVSLTNSTQIKKDSFIAIALSIIFILALLIYYYRNFRSISLIFISVLFGGLFALGIIPLIKNPVSIIAVGVASIIFGIAINYPIHFLSHFKRTADKEQIIKDIVNPLLIGNITTVGAFLSLLFISSDAMKDLGLFASLLLVGTILFVLIFLPHFLPSKRMKSSRESTLAFKRVAEFAPETKFYIVLPVIILTVVFFFFSKRTSFETNMHAINYMTDEQRDAFDKLVAETDTTTLTLYCIAEGKDVDEALSNNETASMIIQSLANSGKIKKISGVGVFLPSQAVQIERLKLWDDFWQDKRENFLSEFDAAAIETGFRTESFNRFREMINRKFQPEKIEYFAPVMHDLAESYVVVENDKSMIYNILTVDKNAMNEVECTLNKINDEIFAFTDSSIASRMVDALSDDFDYVLYICGCIVFVFLLISFGRLEISIMAFIPLAVAWIWILGIMGMTGMKFNIVNIILATFIFGQGDDYSIFVTEGLMYEYRYGRKMLAQFKNSIFLSSSIMFIGIGMLIFAKHPAMKSLAEVTIVGMLSVVVMAYIFPPLIFKWLTRKKGRQRLVPITFWGLIKTGLSFFGFIIGSLIMTITGFFMVVLGHKSDKAKYHFHVAICKTFRFLSKIMPQVACNVINKNDECFDKPSVIICNHQSHLDLMYLLMLSPKIVVLTNEWVSKSIFYGWILQFADYLPVADGIEKNVPKLKSFIDKGYSVLIFPEGTRSIDYSILRFHQGAFYLAEQLNIDILPIIIHGVGQVLPKKEFLLRKGTVTVEIADRIKPDDATYRKDLPTLKISQKIRAFYVNKYADIVKSVETPEYFKQLVIYNYIYKGNNAEITCRRKLKNINSWTKMINELPDNGKILVKRCGQGEFSLLIALVKKQLQIFATDDDADNLALAKNCVSVPENLCYVESIPDTEQFDYIVDENKIISVYGA